MIEEVEFPQGEEIIEFGQPGKALMILTKGQVEVVKPNEEGDGEKLLGILERIHGGTQHRGKVPLRATSEIARQKELMQLREELRHLVESENYERAAQVRDRIRRIEGGAIAGGPDPEAPPVNLDVEGSA